MTENSPGEPAGGLAIDKPAGLTSREVVDQVQKHLSGVKAGHGGTLDRLATGVLPVLLGEGTKLVPYLQEREKVYRARFNFSLVSETLDCDGEVLPVENSHEPGPEEINNALASFSGILSQKPPRYSAIKKDGRRLSDRARNGEEVEPQARPVELNNLRVHKYSFPVLVVEITCGKGFYVRSLARDLATKLELEGGLVEELTRTRYGPFTRTEAVDLDNPGTWSESIFLPRQIVDNLECLELSDRQRKLIGHGTPVGRKQNSEAQQKAIALNSSDRLLAIMRPETQQGREVWQPERGFNLSPGNE